MLKKSTYSMNKIEKKDFYRELFSLAVPIGFQCLLIALIGATDALMLGRLSQDAVAAVSLANQIVFIMNLFISAIVGGGGALVAQYWGKDDKVMVKNLFGMVLKWSFIVSLVFFALAVLLPKQLMRIFTTDQKLIEIGASYLSAVGVSYLFSGITQCFYMIMKIEGNAAKSVVISVFTLISDVVLDIFLIYGYMGVPRLGAKGCAYSTVIVEFIAVVWCVAESHRKNNIHVDVAALKWYSPAVTRDWLKLVYPMLGSSLAWGLSISTHSFIMGHLGSDATAAASIASVMLELVTCVCKGVSAGAGIIIGKLLGQSLFEKAKAYGRKFWHISLWVGGIHLLLLCITAPVITGFFVLTETASQYLTVMLVFTGIYVLAYSVNAIIVCGVLPAGGDTKYDAISVLIATWCFSIPLALLGTFVFKWHVMVIYIVMSLDEIVKVPFLYLRYKKYLWLNNLTRD